MPLLSYANKPGAKIYKSSPGQLSVMICNKRTTQQKRKILENLQCVKTHPTAEMVFDAVKAELPSISLTTVYRNLTELHGEGKILKFEVGGQSHFDGDISLHQHFVCRECGMIFDIFQEKVSRYALRSFQAQGLSANRVNIMYEGMCKACGVG